MNIKLQAIITMLCLVSGPVTIGHGITSESLSIWFLGFALCGVGGLFLGKLTALAEGA